MSRTILSQGKNKHVDRSRALGYHGILKTNKKEK
jgi:hypothetical protein